VLWNELDSLCGFLMLERAPVEFTVNVLGQNSEPRLAARRHVYIEELLVASARGTAKKKIRRHSKEQRVPGFKQQPLAMHSSCCQASKYQIWHNSTAATQRIATAVPATKQLAMNCSDRHTAASFLFKFCVR